jgi:hypothetical protein
VLSNSRAPVSRIASAILTAGNQPHSSTMNAFQSVRQRTLRGCARLVAIRLMAHRSCNSFCPSMIPCLLPSTTPRSQLYAQGKVPEYALFSLTPPAPAFTGITPPVTPSNLAAAFALGFGAGNLLQNCHRLSYLQDAQANPDGGFPTITTGRVLPQFSTIARQRQPPARHHHRSRSSASARANAPRR